MGQEIKAFNLKGYMERIFYRGKTWKRIVNEKNSRWNSKRNEARN